MRVIFLYVQDGNAPGVRFDPSIESTNFYAKRVVEEGYYLMLKRMVDVGIVDEVAIFIESNRMPGVVKYDSPKIYGYVIPDIKDLFGYLRDDDVIFVRGGFKSWYESLVELRNRKHWMMLYAANTGRQKWRIWDVVFNDLSGDNKVDSSHTLQFDFRKPTNCNIFFPKAIDVGIKFDLCIGASHIHDKKGQWHTIEILQRYNKLYGENLKCVMPGSFHRGVKTNEMVTSLKDGSLNVLLPGMVSRVKLNDIYNRSNFFIHLGGGGQGDRGPLEAMSCGTSIILGNTTRHSKMTYKDKYVCTIIPSHVDLDSAAKTLRSLVYLAKRDRNRIFGYHKLHFGIDDATLPNMGRLFGVIRKYPKRDMKVLLLVFNLY